MEDLLPHVVVGRREDAKDVHHQLLQHPLAGNILAQSNEPIEDYELNEGIARVGGGERRERDGERTLMLLSDSFAISSMEADAAALTAVGAELSVTSVPAAS
jgi:hypothetical protein